MTKQTVAATVARTAIFKRIDDNMQQVRQWIEMGDYARAAVYQAKVEALVELLEIDDCGSVGGYDRKRAQPSVPLGGKDRLKIRVDWLKGLPIAA